TPHSSAVCSWTVRSRQLAVSFPNSNAPMVTFVLPASSANSTHTSRENDLVRAVVHADHQESGVVEPRRGALQDGATLPHRYTLATGVTGAEREGIDDGRWSVIDETLDIAVYRRKESDEQLFPRMHMSGFDAKRGGLFRQLAGEARLVDIDPDSGDGGRFHQLRQDAGHFSVSDHDVVGPAEVASDSRGGGDGFGRG